MSHYLGHPTPDNTARTTALLNLRSGAGTSFPVLLVIPSGSTVIITGTIQVASCRSPIRHGGLGVCQLSLR